MREFRRGAVRLPILHHAAEEEIHGAWMTEELARHGYQITPGTLYPTLHRLEACSRMRLLESPPRLRRSGVMSAATGCCSIRILRLRGAGPLYGRHAPARASAR